MSKKNPTPPQAANTPAPPSPSSESYGYDPNQFPNQEEPQVKEGLSGVRKFIWFVAGLFGWLLGIIGAYLVNSKQDATSRKQALIFSTAGFVVSVALILIVAMGGAKLLVTMNQANEEIQKEQLTEEVDSQYQPTEKTEDFAGPEGYFDSFGNLKLVALSELSGSELAQELDTAGYTYSDKTWVSIDKSSSFAIVNSAAEFYSIEDIEAVEKVSDSPNSAFIIISKDQYSNIDKAFNAICGANMKVVNSFEPHESVRVDIVEDKAGLSYFVLSNFDSSDDEPDTYRAIIIDEASISEGFLNTYFNDPALSGTTVEGVWSNVQKSFK